MRFEDFEYTGAAILECPNGDSVEQLLEGVASVSGQLGWETADSPKHAKADMVSLAGVFTANDPIPANFARLSYGMKDGCLLTLVIDGANDPPIPCTIERMEDERSVKILHAGYRHYG